MNKITVYIPYCESDEIHLNNALSYLEKYNLDVCIVKTIPSDYTKLLIAPKKKLNNIEINCYEYNYKSTKDFYNFKDNTFNFSEIKNLAFEIITTDLILFLDSDELLTLDPVFIEWMNTVNNFANVGAFNVNVISYQQLGEDSQTIWNKQNRLIVNNKKVKYNHCIHENIDDSLKQNNLICIDTPNFIIHRGYNNPDVVIPKSKRNIGLLCKELYENLDQQYYYEKLIIAIKDYLLLSNSLQIEFRDDLQINKAIESIQKEGIIFNLDFNTYVEKLKFLLCKVIENKYNKDVLTEIYHRLNYLKILGALK